jgi:RimJ/RimL family protein N-acetyltransferase
MTYQIRSVRPSERPKVLAHTLSLSTDDRHLRFGVGLNDDAISDYINRIDFNKDLVMGVFNIDQKLLGVAHGATYSQDGKIVTELGISIEATLQGQGFGSKLIDEILLRAKLMGSTQLIVQTLTHNTALRAILKKKGGTGTAEGTEFTARFNLTPLKPSARRFNKEAESAKQLSL